MTISHENPRLVALATAVPRHRTLQSDVKAFAARIFGPSLSVEDQRLLEVFDSAGVEARHFVRPIEWYETPRGFGEMNAAYIAAAVDLSAEAIERALERAGLTSRDVDHLILVTTTGIATPSLDALLANRLGLREDLRRTPIWGLGCAGGVAGLARAREFARADRGSRVVLLAVELCSLTFRRADLDVRNLVASALFADGAAAAVVVGSDVDPAEDLGSRFRPLELLASRSTLWKDSLDVMGWTVDDAGLHVVFSREIPRLVRERARPPVLAFLRDQGLALGNVDHWVSHPGGPKVMDAFTEALGLAPGALRLSRDVLRSHGNMSSPTCLFVLDALLASGNISEGQTGLLSALGPGFSCELLLLRA